MMEQPQTEMTPQQHYGEKQKEKKGPYVHIDFSFHLEHETKFDFTYDDEGSIGSSVKSGLRNSLHSSYDFSECLAEGCESGSEASFGGDMENDGEAEALDWRQDPEESKSDWTMVIESVPDGEITEYHVHRRILSKGAKKNDFFVSLFDLSVDKLEDAGASLSKIHIDAAGLIPDMLDFLYSHNDMLNITTETAVGLHHLAQFFGNRTLATAAIAFIHEDMKMDNLKTYLLCAEAFDDLQTQKLCAQRCAEHIEDIMPDSDLLSEMAPSFLLDVISFPRPCRHKISNHISGIVAVYCELNQDFIDGTVFEELTSFEYIPTISPKYALSLIMLESEFVDGASNDHCGLTFLQRRACEALAPFIKFEEGMSCQQQKKRAEALKKLPKKVLVELLSGAFFAP